MTDTVSNRRDRTGGVLFPTHAVVGWLVARGVQPTPASPPDGVRLDRGIWWVVAGSLVPDLIDKPLGAVTPVTLQSVAHSGLGAVVVAALVVGWRLPRGFLLGWLGHLAADVVQLTANSRGGYAAQMLAWPAIRPPPFVLADSPATRLRVFEPLAAALAGTELPILQAGYLAYYVETPGFLLEIGVWAVAGGVVVWRRR